MPQLENEKLLSKKDLAELISEKVEELKQKGLDSEKDIANFMVDFVVETKNSNSALVPDLLQFRKDDNGNLCFGEFNPRYAYDDAVKIREFFKDMTKNYDIGIESDFFTSDMNPILLNKVENKFYEVFEKEEFLKNRNQESIQNVEKEIAERNLDAKVDAYAEKCRAYQSKNWFVRIFSFSDRAEIKRTRRELKEEGVSDFELKIAERKHKLKDKDINKLISEYVNSYENDEVSNRDKIAVESLTYSNGEKAEKNVRNVIARIDGVEQNIEPIIDDKSRINVGEELKQSIAEREDDKPVQDKEIAIEEKQKEIEPNPKKS